MIKASLAESPFKQSFVLGFTLFCGISILLFKSHLLSNSQPKLYQSVSTSAIVNHLQELFNAAEASGSHSRSVIYGYNASAEYVMSQLTTYTDCELSTQNFSYRGYGQYSLKQSRSNVQFHKNDMLILSNNEVQLKSLGVFRADRWYCSLDDFKMVPSGYAISFPIDKDPQCFFEKTVDLAVMSGVSVVFKDFESEILFSMIFEEFEATDLYSHLLDSYPGLIFGFNNELISDYFANDMHPMVDLTFEFASTKYTFNVICETREGDPDSVVVVGAHLDSVSSGPGIIDDGSGSATILEVLLQVYKTGLHKRLRNRLRFIWFSAEEDGLIGSLNYNQYLKSNNTEKSKIVLYMNQDMLGSSNGIPIIRNGETISQFPKLRSASKKITEAYAEYFKSDDTLNTIYHNNYVLGNINVGEDQVSFIRNLIPGGGIANGAGSRKTVEEQKRFGGIAHVAYDPCYHQICDDMNNINKDLLQVLSKSCAYAVEKFALKSNLREWLWRDSESE